MVGRHRPQGQITPIVKGDRMITKEQPTRLILKIDAGAEASPNEVERLAFNLRADLKYLEIDSVEPLLIAQPAGTKAAHEIVPDSMAVALRPNKLVDLIDFVRSWVGNSSRRVEITFHLADAPVVIKALPQDLPGALQALAAFEQTARLNPASQAATPRSGGADLAAQRVDVGGDVVGRDKTITVGHLIIAQEGATIMLGDGAREAA